MNNGYIGLHRKLMQKGFYKKSEFVHLWIHLLLSANFKDKEFFFNNQNMIVKRGQLITGRLQLAKSTGLNQSKVERILKYLKTEQQIEQQTFNKFRLITIINYNEYQPSEQHFEQQVNNNRTTSEQQVNTNNKDNNINKVNKVKGENFFSPTPKEKIELFFEMVKSRNSQYQEFILNLSKGKNLNVEIIQAEIDRFTRYWTEKTLSGKKEKWELQKTFEVDRRLTTWFSNFPKFNSTTKNNQFDPIR